MAQPITDIRTANPDQTLLNLTQDTLFFALKDPDSGKILGKIIAINGPTSYEPTTNTASMLLYLLAGADDDSILLSDFLELATKKFNGATTDDIYTFLDKLKKNHKILNPRVGTNASRKPDPLDLFDPPQIPWEPNPDITQSSKTPVCRVKTFHSINAGYVRIPR